MATVQVQDIEAQLVTFINNDVIDPGSSTQATSVRYYESSDSSPLDVYQVTSVSKNLDLYLVFDDGELISRKGFTNLKPLTNTNDGSELQYRFETFYSSNGDVTQSVVSEFETFFATYLAVVSDLVVTNLTIGSTDALEVFDITLDMNGATRHVFLIFDDETDQLVGYERVDRISDFSAGNDSDTVRDIFNTWHSSEDVTTEVQAFWDNSGGLTVTGNAAQSFWNEDNKTDTITINVDTVSYGSFTLISQALEIVIVFNDQGVLQSSTGLADIANASYSQLDLATLEAGMNTWYSTAFPDITSVSNTAPVAVNDSFTTSEGANVNLDFLSNDTDAEDSSLDYSNITVVSNFTHGSLSTTGDYTPVAGFVGDDTMTYTVNDSDGVTSNTATVTVTVTAAASVTPDDTWNDAAGIAHQEYILVDDGTTLKINEKTALGSDLIYEISLLNNSATMTGTLVTSAGTTFTNISATATFDPSTDNGDGSLVSISGTATVSTGESGTLISSNSNSGYVITYTDGNGDVHTIEVTDDMVETSNFIDTGSAANTAPTLISSTPADDATMDSDANIVLTFSEDVQAGTGDIIIKKDDGTPVKTIGVTNTDVVTFDGRTVTIDPTSDFVDGKGYYFEIASGVITDTATTPIAFAGISGQDLNFTTNITSVSNTAPVAVNDSFTTSEGANVNLDILSNDTDAEDSSLDYSNITVVSNFTHGSLSTTGDYTPVAGFVGDDTMTYTVNDSDGATSNTATVTVTVTAAVNGGNYTASDLIAEISLDDQGNYSNKSEAEAHNADINNANDLMDILEFNMVWLGQPLSNWSMDLNKDGNDAVAFKTIDGDFYYIIYDNFSDNSTYVSYKNDAVFSGSLPSTSSGAPVSSPIPDLGYSVGEHKSLYPDQYFYDPEGLPLTYTVESALDGGAVLSMENWLSTPIPTDAGGDYLITIIATDNDNNETRESFTITVGAFDGEQDGIEDGLVEFFHMLGIDNFQDSLTVTVDFNDSTHVDTFNISVGAFTFNNSNDANGFSLTLAFQDDGTLISQTGLDAANVVAIPGFDAQNIEDWYKYADPDSDDDYAFMAVEDLFSMTGIYDWNNLQIVTQANATGEVIIIDVDSFEFNGIKVYSQHYELTFEYGKVVNKTGIPTESEIPGLGLDNAFSDSSLDIWYEFSSPDEQKEEDQRDDGFFDDSHDYQETWTNIWTWTDGDGTIWTVVDQDINGVWTSTESGSNGAERSFAGSWDHDTQTNTFTETFRSADGAVDYVRVEVSGPTGTTNTYTGKTNQIGWQQLDQIYTISTESPIVETLDAYWSTTGITGTATGEDNVEVEFGFSDWQITIGGESVSHTDFDEYFDDFFSGTKDAWTWTDWDGTVWQVTESDENGTWTTNEIAYTDESLSTKTGDERTSSSSWDQSTQTNIWSETWTDASGSVTKTETQSPTGTIIVTQGYSDYVGWTYLGEFYSNLDVTETMDSNWNTTDISGTGDNSDGIAVTFAWDANTWQVTVDRNDGAGAQPVGGYDTYMDAAGGYQESSSWTSDPWTWQDGSGITWTVIDKQEGDTWTSTETGDNGDSRISISSWNNETQVNTWSEEIINQSVGLDFKVTETYREDGTSSTRTEGNADRIGWTPLDGVYTNVDVTEERDANWNNISVTGTGFNESNTQITFGLSSNGWQLTMDDGSGAIDYDPWAQTDSYIDPDSIDYSDPNFDQQSADTWTSDPWTWTDWSGAIWTVIDVQEGNIWTTTETSDKGDVRVWMSTWDQETNTSTWSESFIAADGRVDFQRTETYNQDGTSSVTTTGKDDQIGWEYLGEVYTSMNVTLDRNINWETTGIRGTGVNAEGETVEFGFENNQITIDGDTIGNLDHGDQEKADDNFEYSWTYVDEVGVEWTVVDSQDGDWWKSKETSSNGDVRVNKSKWSDGDDDNGDGFINASDNGSYSKFVSKFKSADEAIKYKMVEKYYDDYQGSGEARSVMVVKGTSDYLGWDYLGEIYTDIDFKVVRDGNWNVIKINTAQTDSNGDTLKDDNGDPLQATAKNANGVEVAITAGNYGEILIDGRDIYQINDDFFDFGDTGMADFEMQDDGWDYGYVDYNSGVAFSVTESEVDGKWVTIETNDLTGEITKRISEYDPVTDKNTETEIKYLSQIAYDNDNQESSETRTNSFVVNDDGGYSMVQSVSSTLDENYTRTETYNADGTTTITTIGTLWYKIGDESLLVRDAEVTEQLDQNWQHTDYTGRRIFTWFSFLWSGCREHSSIDRISRYKQLW